MDDDKFDARTAWNEGAEAFVEFVDSGADYYRHLVHGPALLEVCGDVKGANVLDLGCGHGYFSRLLARAGAGVVGVDIADHLIAKAIEYEQAEPLGVRYLRMEAERIGKAFEQSSVDLVTACTSLQDMSDPAAIVEAVRAVLSPSGRFTFSVPHPCTDTPWREWKRDESGRKLALCLDRYFEGGPATCDWNMARLKYPWQTPFHRLTLTQWAELVERAGLVISRLREPRPTAELAARHPQLDDCFRMPFFLVLELTKRL
jgi:2-polyprenyl-3-methyl-5-hydroxy-6-metoxy-1,4-benzoquinol methylase